MTIETKYNIGDEVWVMHDNKVKRGIIIKIDASLERDMNSQNVGKSVYYGLYDFPYPYIENHIFTTKEELLKSL